MLIKNLTLSILLIALFAELCFAQSAPDFVYSVQIGSTGQTPATSWNVISGASSPYVYSRQVVGSASGNSLSSTFKALANGYKPNKQGINMSTGIIVGLYVKGSASLSYNYTITGQANVYSTGSAPNATAIVSRNGGANVAYSNITSAGSASNSGAYTSSGSANLSCASNATPGNCTTFAQYPGVVYCQVPAVQSITGNSSILHTSGGASIDLLADGNISFSATRGADSPIAILGSNLVNGVPTNNPATGSTVTVQNLSYDSDDNLGSTPLEGICTKSWQVLDSVGNVVTSGASSNPQFVASNPGDYTVNLTVTDNEGMSSNTSKTITVDPGEVGDGDDQQVDGTCSEVPGGPSAKASTNTRNGNTQSTYRSNSPTEFNNDVTLNSQSRMTARTTSMGNASHSYSLFAGTANDQYGNQRRYVADADGQELDFGLTSGAITKGRKVFSDFAYTTSGSTLYNAGPPENINWVGNYTYEFNTAGYLTSITDPSGNVQQISYNTDNTIDEVADLTTGRVQSYEYDTAGLVARIVEPGAVTHISYTGNLVSKIERKDSSNTTILKTEYFYNANNQISKMRADGDTSTDIDFTYQKYYGNYYTGNFSDQHGFSSNLSFFQPTTQAGGKYETRRTNAQSGVSKTVYDANGNIVAEIEPAYYGSTVAPKTTYTTNSSGQITSATNTRKTVNYTYNSLGLLTQKAVTGGQTLTLTYSGADLVSVSDQDGTILTYAYTDTSHPHSPTSMTNAGGATWTYTYTSDGQISTITPPSGSVTGATTYAYYGGTPGSNNYKKLQSITNGAGDVVSYGNYTALGEVLSITTSPSSGITNTTQYEYDEANRLTKITLPDTTTQQWSYAGKFLDSYLDENANLTQYEWCKGCGKIKKEILPEGKTLNWSYNSDRSLATFTDGMSGANPYTYGNAGELKKEAFADTQNIEYKYDDYGLLKQTIISSTTSSGDPVSILARDSSERVTQRHTDTGGSNYFTYKHDDRLNTVGTNVVDTTYTYDSSRRLTKASYNFTDSGLTRVQDVEYTYTPDNLVSTMTWKDNGSTVTTWTYSYDQAGRQTQVSNSFGDTTSYTYDSEGKVLTQSNSNNTSTTYSYNQQRGWVTSIDHKLSSTSFETYDLTYDTGLNTVGNITQIEELDGSIVSYSYDDLYRLLSESRTTTNPYSKTYTYDYEGNILTVNSNTYATYDNANKFASIPSGTVTYDNFGSLTYISSPVHPTTTYAYNGKNETTFIQTSWGRIDYKYNEQSLRVVKIPPTSTDKRWYVFSGTTLIGEVGSSGATLAYTHGADGLVSMRDVTTNTSRFFHYGAQGETRYLTNSSGSVTDSYYYEAYGNPVISSGSTYNPNRYGGKFGYYKDDGGESLLATWRWYSPSQMRWINRDPIKFDGGSNVYQYVEGNPVKNIDPSGLEVQNPTNDDWWAKDETDRGGWYYIPPGKKAPISPDGVYNPKTKQVWKTHGYEGTEDYLGDNDVTCDQDQPHCYGGTCYIFQPYIKPNTGWKIPEKTPPIHPGTTPIINSGGW